MLNEPLSSRHSNDKGVVDEEGVESVEKSNEEKIWVQCNACEKVSHIHIYMHINRSNLSICVFVCDVVEILAGPCGSENIARGLELRVELIRFAQI